MSYLTLLARQTGVTPSIYINVHLGPYKALRYHFLSSSFFSVAEIVQPFKN